jgi:peroxiredoxin Q/BCP
VCDGVEAIHEYEEDGGRHRVCRCRILPCGCHGGPHSCGGTLPSNRGKDIALSDYAGKRLVLYTFPGDFTSGCTIEAQAFERDFNKYQDLKSEILGMSVDSVEKHLDFCNTYNLEFPLVSDKGGSVSKKYGSLLDLSFMGKFSNRQTYIISPTGNIEKVFTDVGGKVAKHSEDVLKELSELPPVDQIK